MESTESVESVNSIVDLRFDPCPYLDLALIGSEILFRIDPYPRDYIFLTFFLSDRSQNLTRGVQGSGTQGF